MRERSRAPREGARCLSNEDASSVRYPPGREGSSLNTNANEGAHMSTTKSTKDLSAELERWFVEQSIPEDERDSPDDMIAISDNRIHTNSPKFKLSEPQRSFLVDFLRRWDDAQRTEDRAAHWEQAFNEASGLIDAGVEADHLVAVLLRRMTTEQIKEVIIEVTTSTD